jgi:hypothetical protein
MIALLGSNVREINALKAISRMVKPVAGVIEYQGQPTAGRSPNSMVRLGIAHVAEGRRIFKDLAVLENLRMGAYTRNDTDGIAQDLAMVFDLFPRLKERTKQLGGSLSGGEQQSGDRPRTDGAPRLLLLDEPSLGLAPNLVADIFAVAPDQRPWHDDADRREKSCGTEEHLSGLRTQVGKVACSGRPPGARTKIMGLTWAFAHDVASFDCPGSAAGRRCRRPARDSGKVVVSILKG